NGGKNSLNRLIRCVCGKKIGPDPRNFNQRVSLGRNDLLIRTFLRCRAISAQFVSSDLIALFELKIDEGQVKLIEERHYKLVPVKELDSSDISNYRMSV
ncbi:hypothetical protein, partial [Klebsiella pneumoniae]